MARSTLMIFAAILFAVATLAQPPDKNPAPAASQSQTPQSQTPQSQPPTAPQPLDSDDSDGASFGSSSRRTRTDISPPKDDAKNHPNSHEAVADLESPPPDSASGVQEFHPWNPMKALKDVEVADYYFKQKNYRAALDRYKEALYYKNGDAIATFRLAQCQEKLRDLTSARSYYAAYLKILPQGEFAGEAEKALERLKKSGK